MPIKAMSSSSALVIWGRRMNVGTPEKRGKTRASTGCGWDFAFFLGFIAVRRIIKHVHPGRCGIVSAGKLITTKVTKFCFTIFVVLARDSVVKLGCYLRNPL